MTRASLRGLNSLLPSERGVEIALIGFVGLFFFICFMIAGRRSFDFDEFQVLYASASILRGKAYFAERIGVHFPLCNILMSLIIAFTGFKSFALLVSRYFIFFVGVFTCVYTYRVAFRLWNRSTGLLAVAILLSNFVFAEKGLEIRHDVFNMLFNVMAAYYGIHYLAEKKTLQLVACGLLLGMAIASTQKAAIWSAGIVLGLLATLPREGQIRNAGKMILAFAGLIPIPLVLCLAGLVAVGDESILLFFRHAVFERLPYFHLHAQDLFPFPYDRWHLLKELVKPNPFFYTAAVAGLALFALKKKTSSPQGILVLVVWCVLGLLFYLNMRRPFFQSFLPTVPPLAILASGFLMEVKNASSRFPVVVKAGIVFACGVFLFVWPLRFLAPMTHQDDRLYHQLYNTSYCLANLQSDEKVLCFTQNQIFFDPVFPMKNSTCGVRFYSYDPACFERVMIQEQCRVIINDYRSQLLNRGIKARIKENYIALKRGNILIPGFRLEPNQVVEKNVWIGGYYYSPTLSLMVDGEKIRAKLLQLTQGVHTFSNLQDCPLTLVYFFEKGTSLENTQL